jgi:hypothetical protein
MLVFCFVARQHQHPFVHLRFVLGFSFCFVFVFSFVLFACACRSRWGPCMSHEALSWHSCNLPSFQHAELLLLCPGRMAKAQFSRNACLVRRVSGIATSRFQNRQMASAAVCATGNRPSSPNTAALGVPVRTPTIHRRNFRWTSSQVSMPLPHNAPGPHVSTPYSMTGRTSASNKCSCNAGSCRLKSSQRCCNASAARWAEAALPADASGSKSPTARDVNPQICERVKHFDRCMHACH